MTTDPSLVPGLDALAHWRRALTRELAVLTAFLTDHELLPPAEAAVAESLRQRVAADKLVLAFVAEFSRGKSELINAIFFADTGRRILPATPGRTTMCPVELAWTPADAPGLWLLPIDSRREGDTLAQLRVEKSRWSHLPLDPADPAALATALSAVTRTRAVPPAVARDLGLWSDDDPSQNPPLDERGQVEIPAWRHALINYPHPLLAQGLVIIDTPGLNAIGTEPELTLGLLPGAHAVLFLLGADTGVTKSDLAVWNDALGGRSLACFGVLNKIDTFDDPLLSPAQVADAVERQCEVAAQTLRLSRERIFPISARQALHARLAGDAVALDRSRLPSLEAALSQELLPARQQVLAQAVLAAAESLQSQLHRQLRDQRNQNAEQLLELRGLRGKSAARVRHLLDRVTDDAAEFERSAARLAALRSVQGRHLKDVQGQLSARRVQDELRTLLEALDSGWLQRGARQAFEAVCEALRRSLGEAAALSAEAREMLQGSFRQLNAEFGFSLSISLPPELALHRQELAAIERATTPLFGLAKTMRMASPAYRERLVRMLAAKFEAVFDSAARDIELWNQSASAQMEAQLRDRRRSFRKRRESLERIQQAAGDLEERVADVETQAAGLEVLVVEATRRCEALAALARRGPAGAESEHVDLPLGMAEAV